MKEVVIILFLIFSLSTYNNADEIPNCKENESLGCTKSQVYICTFESKINALIETLRQTLQNGNGKIPSFDPLEIPEQELNLNSVLIRGNLKISNFVLQGVTDFIKTKGCLNIDTLEIGLHFDQLVLNTGYSGRISLFDMVTIFGTGEASITLKDFSINVDMKLDLLGPSIKSIVVDLALPSTIDIKITGLLDDERMSDIISRQLTDTLETLVKEEEERLNKILNELIAKLLEGKPPNPIKQIQETHEENTLDNISEVLQDLIQNMSTKKDYIISELTRKYLEEY